MMITEVRTLAEKAPNQSLLPPRTFWNALGAIFLFFTTVFQGAAQDAAPIEPKPAEPKPAKRVEIDKTTQMLRAYEGGQVIIETRVSTGRWGPSTPNGEYLAGPKERLHRSKKYHNAPMPFSIPVTGNVFIHGFTSVPRYPASHGCVRVPMGKDNPAEKLYLWIETGTPIQITGEWPD